MYLGSHFTTINTINIVLDFMLFFIIDLTVSKTKHCTLRPTNRYVAVL